MGLGVRQAIMNFNLSTHRRGKGFVCDRGVDFPNEQAIIFNSIVNNSLQKS